VQAAEGGCSFVRLSLVSVTSRAGVADKASCLRDIPAIHAQVEKAYRPDVWLISDRFLGNALATDDGRILLPGDPRRRRLIVGAVRDKLARLTSTGARAVVLAVPPLGQPADCAVGRASAATCASPLYTLQDDGTAEINQIIRDAVAGLGSRVAVVSVDDVLCPVMWQEPAAVAQ